MAKCPVDNWKMQRQTNTSSRATAMSLARQMAFFPLDRSAILTLTLRKKNRTSLLFDQKRTKHLLSERVDIKLWRRDCTLTNRPMNSPKSPCKNQLLLV